MRVRSAVTVVALSLCAGCSSTFVRSPGGLIQNPDSTASVSDHRVGETGEDEALPGPDREAVQALIQQPKMEEVLERFRRERHGSVQVALSRGAQYIDMIARELSREGVPPELAYLPIIESGFAVRARGGSAVGMWQMTPDTARRYGLLVSSEVDERCDPEKSTRAAARMLRELYDTFADWELAIAAYNAGPGRVQRALEIRPEASFWELADRGLLPPITRDYVPHVLAAMKFGAEDLPASGDSLGDAVRPLRYDTYVVARRMDFQTIASLSGSEPSEIAELNPHLMKGVVPARADGYPVKLPQGSGGEFERNYLALVSAVDDTPEVVPASYSEPRAGNGRRGRAEVRRAGTASSRPTSRGQAGRRVDPRRAQRT